MHIRSKFDGGKVIHRSQSGSWEHRSMGAGLRQNLGNEWGPQVWKEVTSSSPNKVYTSVTSHSAKILEKQRKQKATEEAKQKRRQSKYTRKDESSAARKAYSRHDDGITPEDITEDISAENLEQLKSSYYQSKVAVNTEQGKFIERQTRDQAECSEWITERRKRITASKAGCIAKMKQTTKRSSKVKDLLYSSFRGNQATRYGADMESITIKEYITYQRENGHPGITVQKCGLYISEQNNWLAATPDGLVNDPEAIDHQTGLLEIKNPYSARDKSLLEACSVSSFCLELNKENKTPQLKCRHDYYFQVQCQLYCVNVQWCDFVVRSNKGIHVKRVYRDSKWWGLQMAKLRKFYFTALLPEPACPRHRQGGIREPLQDTTNK